MYSGIALRCAAMQKQADRILSFVAPGQSRGHRFTRSAHRSSAVKRSWRREKEKCDAIVVASHSRRGVSALLLGSETQKVFTHSKLPVIVVR